MARQEERQQKPGGTVAVVIGMVVVLLLGAAGWYWHISHVHGITPAPVKTPVAPTTATAAPAAHLYPEAAAANGDVSMALLQAKTTGKRIILDFGGDWCPDCQVLDIYFQQNPNAELLAQNFVKVNVNIGHMDQNVDLAERYGVPLKKGVPALAVLNADGKLLYAQKAGEFEAMRRMDSSSVTKFLNQWKPQRG